MCPHPAAFGHPGAAAGPHGRAPQAPHHRQAGQRIRLGLKDQLATLSYSAEMLTFDSSTNLIFTIKFRMPRLGTFTPGPAFAKLVTAIQTDQGKDG